jgi:hypothetical protein
LRVRNEKQAAESLQFGRIINIIFHFFKNQGRIGQGNAQHRQSKE